MHIKRIKKSAAGAAVGLCLAVSAFGNAEAADELIVPVATWGSPTHINIVEFVGPLEEILKRETDGRITVRHFPAGQLAQDADMPVAIPTGKVKFGWITINGWSGSIPDVKIADAPTGLTMEQMAAATDGENGIKAVLDKQFKEKGATLLAVTDIGPAVIVSNKKVVSTDDLKGLKIRVYSEGAAQLAQALGAAPVQLPFADVYTAMQRGTIDAAMIGFQGVASQRMYEVADYLLIPASFLGTGLQGWAANLAWWDSLDPNDRKIVAAAIREAELAARKGIIEDRATLAEEYRSKGMTVTSLEPSMPEYQSWVATMEPVLENARKSLSPEIFAPIEKIKAQASKSQ